MGYRKSPRSPGRDGQQATRPGRPSGENSGRERFSAPPLTVTRAGEGRTAMRATEIRTADAMRSHTRSPSGWRSLATIVLIGACGGSLVSAADQSAGRSDFPVAAGDDEIPPARRCRGRYPATRAPLGMRRGRSLRSSEQHRSRVEPVGRMPGRLDQVVGGARQELPAARLRLHPAVAHHDMATQQCRHRPADDL